MNVNKKCFIVCVNGIDQDPNKTQETVDRDIRKEAIREANSASSQTKVARSFNQPDSTYIRNKAKLKSAAEKFWARRSRSATPDTLCNYFRQAGLTIVGESTVETQTTY